MNFQEYQKEAKETAIYPKFGAGYVYPALGLAGESGEVAEKIKKIIRDNNGIAEDRHKEALKKEMGDVLWYLSQIATELDLDLDDIAETNIKKLQSRKDREKINGDGDDR